MLQTCTFHWFLDLPKNYQNLLEFAVGESFMIFYLINNFAIGSNYSHIYV